MVPPELGGGGRVVLAGKIEIACDYEHSDSASLPRMQGINVILSIAYIPSHNSLVITVLD